MTRFRIWMVLAISMIAFASVGVLAATQSGDTKGRRVVPVTNVVPTGAQPIKGAIVKVEVVDALDLERTNWQLKVAVRVRNVRALRVQCSLRLKFDGELMGSWLIDLPAGQSDLTVFAGYCGKGKGAEQLSKLTAEATDIRLGN